MSHERVGICRIPQKSRDITHENKPARLERNRRPSRRDVRVAIVDLAVIAAGRRTNHRSNAAPDAFAQRLDIHLAHFSDKTEIEWFSIYIEWTKFSAPENLRAGKPAGFTAEALNRLRDFRIDLARQYSVDNFRGGGVGYAVALHKFSFQPGGFERTRNCLAAAMHDHRINADRFKENNVSRDAMPHLRIIGIHETAAIFHDKNLAAKTLNVGQRFQQRRSFGNDLFHFSLRKSIAQRPQRTQRIKDRRRPPL